jgi:peptidoglycan/xylan/chitin deacetylase (PgdA/CDA1 family)
MEWFINNVSNGTKDISAQPADINVNGELHVCKGATTGAMTGSICQLLKFNRILDAEDRAELLAGTPYSITRSALSSSRQSVPQNYQRQPPITFEAFDDITDWVVAGDVGGSIAIDHTYVRDGDANALRIHSMTANGTTATKTTNFYGPPGVMWFWAYRDPTLNTKTAKVIFRWYTKYTDPQKYFRAQVTCYHYNDGWTKCIILPNDWVAYGEATWSEPVIRNRIYGLCPQGGEFDLYISPLYAHNDSIPKCVIMFDDSRTSVYDTAYPIMAARGLVGTSYLNSSAVGLAGKCTLTQLQELYAAGWAISNHGDVHDLYEYLPDETVALYISTCRDWLRANGFVRSADYFALPNGSYNARTAGILEDCEVNSARCSESGLDLYPYFNIRLMHGKGSGGLTVDAMIAAIDDAVQKGATVFPFFHDVVETPDPEDTTQCSIEYFTEVMDHLVACGISCVTIDEWYKGHTNPRYQSLPVGRT